MSANPEEIFIDLAFLFLRICVCVFQNGRRTGGRKSYAGNRGLASHTSASWPCEIDGCGKQFVREADLRRHQRTTRVHANPN